MKKYALASLAFLVLFLAGYSGNDPDPLAGTWKMNGILPMTVQFRSGETEAMGMIEKVSYMTKGRHRDIQRRDDERYGNRYTVTGPNTVHNELGTLQRIR